MAKTPDADTTNRIHPDHIYRKHQGPKIFGVGKTKLDEQIKSREIEPPMSLSDGGRAKGWLGSVIIEHQQKRLAKHRAALLAKTVSKDTTPQATEPPAKQVSPAVKPAPGSERARP